MKYFVFCLLTIGLMHCNAKSKQAMQSSAKPSAAQPVSDVTGSTEILNSWDYMVKETPMGNVEGVLTVFKEKNEIKATLKGENGVLQVENLKYDPNKMTGQIYFDGTPIQLDLKFNGDLMDGILIAGSAGQFNVTGKKKSKS
jgi:hypothetical protein